MANTAPKSIRRLQIGANVLLQVFFLGLIVMMVNYFSFHHYERRDFTRNHKFTLSDQTRHVLANLKDEVRATVFFTGDPRNVGAEVYPDVVSLMTEYGYASKKKFVTEFVDPFRDFSRARELSAKYKFGNENVLILDYKGRTKLVNAADMAIYDQRYAMLGEKPQYKAFRGEQAVTSALIELIEGKENKMYLLAGHGEPDLESDTYRLFKTYVERQNVKLATLKLQSAAAIPADAKAVCLLGPRYDLSERELEILKNYWAQKGRLFVALDPTATTPLLDKWISELGVKPQDDRVLGVFKMPGVDALAVVRDVQGEFAAGNPITKRLTGATATLPSSTQSLAIDTDRSGGPKIQPLIKAAEGYWGETHYNVNLNAGERVELDKEDHQNPVVAVALEQGGVADERVQVESARMILVGNSDFTISTALMQIPADVDFILAGVNWLLDRQELIGITPKEKQLVALNLDEHAMGRLTLLTMVIMPAGILLLALAVWVQRRA